MNNELKIFKEWRLTSKKSLENSPVLMSQTDHQLFAGVDYFNKWKAAVRVVWYQGIVRNQGRESSPLCATSRYENDSPAAAFEKRATNLIDTPHSCC